MQIGERHFTALFLERVRVRTSLGHRVTFGLATRRRANNKHSDER